MSKSVTTTRPKRGWSSIIGELTAADDLRAFNQGILDLQYKIVAGEYGALWVKDQAGELCMVEGWPPQITQQGPDLPVYKLLQEAASGGFERATSHVLKVEPEGSDDPPGIGAHVFVTVLRVKEQIIGVTTVVADCRDPGVLQATAPMRELAAGLYEIFFLKQDVKRQAQETEQVRAAMAMLATAQDAPGFKGSCLNLVNELARQLKCMRVTLGWIKGRSVVLQAMSDTEDLKRHSEQVVLIESAMSECLDQEQPIVFPVTEDVEPLLAQAITHSHARLAESGGNRHITSVPLRVGDEWVGVITLERTDQPFDGVLVTQIQLIADVVAPQLEDRRDSDRWLVGHAWKSTTWAASYLVGAKHVGWKMLALLIIGVLIFICAGTWPYKVMSDFEFQFDSKRIVSAPYESDLIESVKRKGDPVRQGDVLARLNDVELRLQLAEAKSRYNIAVQERAKAEAAPGLEKQNEAQQAQARMDEAKAQIDLLDYQLNQSAIRAPIDGIVMAGDWHDRVGGVVGQGEAMFEVAPEGDLIVMIRVDEADIDQIQQYIAAEGRLPDGRLATRSQPEEKFDFVIEKIIPLAGPHENANVFEVRARMVEPAGWLKAGMEGNAHIDVGSKPIYWILTHKITETVRLWLWW